MDARIQHIRVVRDARLNANDLTKNSLDSCGLVTVSCDAQQREQMYEMRGADLHAGYGTIRMLSVDHLRTRVTT